MKGNTSREIEKGPDQVQCLELILRRSNPQACMKDSKKLRRRSADDDRVKTNGSWICFERDECDKRTCSLCGVLQDSIQKAMSDAALQFVSSSTLVNQRLRMVICIV